MDASVRAIPILSIIYGLSRLYDKRYCYPSQEKLKEFLRNRLGVYISISTLNRWLRESEDAGYLTRQRRIRHDKRLGMVFQTTIYYMANRGYLLLARCGILVGGKLKELRSELRKQAPSGSKKKAPAPPPEEVDYLTGVEVSERIKEYLNPKPL